MLVLEVKNQPDSMAEGLFYMIETIFVGFVERLGFPPVYLFFFYEAKNYYNRGNYYFYSIKESMVVRYNSCGQLCDHLLSNNLPIQSTAPPFATQSSNEIHVDTITQVDSKLYYRCHKR